jgi:hypothetical protein
MDRSISTWFRATEMWAVLLCGVALGACTPDPLAKFTYTVKLQKEPLPSGVSADPDTFRAQITSRTPGPTHSELRLGKCHGSPCLVQVTIGPLGDTREINPNPPIIPASGRAVAKILNLDSVGVADMYGFKPSALFEYYVWADTAAYRLRMTLLEVPAVGQPGSVQAVFEKSLRICHLDPSPPMNSDADFRWCAGLTAVTPRGMFQAGLLPTAELLPLLSRAARRFSGKSMAEAAIWLRCKDGCCG